MKVELPEICPIVRTFSVDSGLGTCPILTYFGVELEPYFYWKFWCED